MPYSNYIMHLNRQCHFLFILFQWVGSIDLGVNELADANVIVKPELSMPEQESEVSAKVGDLLGDNKLDGILCVAGGWAGGNAKSKSKAKLSKLLQKT